MFQNQKLKVLFLCVLQPEIRDKDTSEPPPKLAKVVDSNTNNADPFAEFRNLDDEIGEDSCEGHSSRAKLVIQYSNFEQ